MAKGISETKLWAFLVLSLIDDFFKQELVKSMCCDNRVIHKTRCWEETGMRSGFEYVYSFPSLVVFPVAGLASIAFLILWYRQDTSAPLDNKPQVKSFYGPNFSKYTSIISTLPYSLLQHVSPIFRTWGMTYLQVSHDIIILTSRIRTCPIISSKIVAWSYLSCNDPPPYHMIQWQ